MKTAYYKKTNRKAITKFLLLFVFIIIFTNISVHAEMLSVKGDKVNLRTGPGKNYNVVWEYGAGFPVKVVDRKGNWLKIKDFEDDSGWVHKSLLINRPQTIVKANRNKDEKINIRKEPGSESKIVGKAYYGVVFKVLRFQSGWVEVQHETGLKGWISSNLLWGY